MNHTTEETGERRWSAPRPLAGGALGAMLLFATTGATAQPEASCLAPSMEVAIVSVELAPGANPGTVLTLEDPNPPGSVSGYNIYRSPDPSLPRPLWSLLAVDAGDENPDLPGVQWTDPSWETTSTGLFYYLAAAYDDACGQEGPWNTSGPEDHDRDGVAGAADRCPSTPAGVSVLADGCAASDLVLQPEALLAPVDDGIAAFLAANGGGSAPDPVVESLGLAGMSLALATDEFRSVDACAAAMDAAATADHMADALAAVDDYLAQLGAVESASSPGADDGTGTEGPIVWPSDEILYWQGQRFVLSNLVMDATDASRTAGEVCAAEGPLTSLAGRIRMIQDADHLFVLQTGERIAPSPTAVRQGRERPAEDADIGAEGRYYGPIFVATLLDKAASLYPFLPGLNYDGCLQIRLAPPQPSPGNPYWQNAPIHHSFDGYLDGNGVMQLEAGDLLVAEDTGCPGILPGAGPSGEDLRLDYYYELELTYTPKQGGIISGQVLAQQLDGNSGTVPFPDIDPQVNGLLQVTKLKRTCLDSGLTFPIIDPISGNVVGTQTAWSCSGEQTVASNVYSVRVRDPQSYCSVDYGQAVFSLEDDDTTTWVSTAASGITVSPDAPLPATFSAYGDLIVNGNPVHGQLLGLGQTFALYGPFGHPHAGYGTNHRSYLDWPHIDGARNGHAFRYTCAVPRIVTDMINACFTSPPTFYRLPYPADTSVTVWQGNGGSYSHNGWQFYALDLSGIEGDPIRAARGGTVVRVRSDMMLNCLTQTCTNFGFPLLDEYGNSVAIQHQDGTVSWYAHMVPGSPAVFVGQKVKRGTYLGQLGNTGNSTDPHLHFHVTPESPASWGNTTILARYEATHVPDLTTDICIVPQQGETYLSTNSP